MMQPRRHDYLLGIDLGGTKILAVVADAPGNIISRDRNVTPASEGPEAVMRSIVEAANSALVSAGIPAGALTAIGICAPGPLTPETGIVRSAPNLPGWKDVPLRDMVEREFGVLTVLENDANAAAYAELRYGAARGALNVVYVTLGTGIGGGIIVDGKLYRGATGAAGEIGHMTIDVHGPPNACGNFGCWELYASGTAMEREAARRIQAGAVSTIGKLASGDVALITAEIVHAAAEEGDRTAQDVIAWTAYHLGVGLVALANIFNPELIVIGGGLTAVGEPLLAPARRMVREHAFRAVSEAVRIATAELRGDAGVLGATALADDESHAVSRRRRQRRGASAP